MSFKLVMSLVFLVALAPLWVPMTAVLMAASLAKAMVDEVALWFSAP